MQKELQLTLSIIGILIIGGVLLHGMWTIRKNKKSKKNARIHSGDWERNFQRDDTAADDAPLYDDIGVGKARVITKAGQENGHNKLGANDNDDSPNISHDVKAEHSVVDEKPYAKDNDKFDHSIDSFEPHDKNNLDDELVRQGPAHLDVVPRDIKNQDTFHSDASTANDENYELGKKPDDKETSSNAAQEDSNQIEAAEVRVQSEPPVYSNVVTQPKPEFTRPIQDSVASEDDVGQPPGFLLRKTSEEREVQEKHPEQLEPKKLYEQPDDSKVVKAEANQVPEPLSVKNEIKPNPITPTEPKPDFSLNIQEGPKINSDSEAAEDLPIGVEKELSFAQQAKRFVKRNKKTVAEKIRKEPVIQDKAASDQMRMEFSESETAKAQETENAENTSAAKTTQSSSTNTEHGATDVLVLNVRANDENPIQGASLLPMLLTLGFKFGEHDIFHRHVNTNGKGPILFSLTNMFKPGVFDIDNIEVFSTHGLSLFMMLPIEGDAQQVFNMMHNAARKLSEEFDCRILDGNKVGVSKQSLQQYVERIRDFERKRINK